MGLLDQIGGVVGGALGQGKGAGVNAILLQQLVSMLSKPGALSNLTNAFQGAGLGDTLQSWIGTGQNLPISAGLICGKSSHGSFLVLRKTRRDRMRATLKRVKMHCDAAR